MMNLLVLYSNYFFVTVFILSQTHYAPTAKDAPDWLRLIWKQDTSMIFITAQAWNFIIFGLMPLGLQWGREATFNF